jgi:hypothetical protein
MGSKFSQPSPKWDGSTPSELAEATPFLDDFDRDDRLEKGERCRLITEYADHTNSRKTNLLSRIVRWIVEVPFTICSDLDRLGSLEPSSSVPATATPRIRP